MSLLALLLAGAGPALARQQPSPPTPGAAAAYDLPGDTRALQQLLTVLGYYHDEPSGRWDEGTAGALQAFQADYGLPATGEVDEATLEALGGPTSRLNDRPRFQYAPGPDESLADIARRFGSPLPWLARFNPFLRSIDGPLDDAIPEPGIVVPVPFPLPSQFQAERVEVLPGRFLGTYASGVPFAGVGMLAEQMTGLLQESGFEVEPSPTPLDGITVRGNGVVLGRVVFSASPADGTARVHLALLFLHHDELEQELEEGAWLQGGEAGGE